MKRPGISVVVPVYNVEDYLGKCLDSILAQDFEDIEIIIVDDGATDKSGEIADKYARDNPDKIQVIHQENAGLGGARNTGIDRAKGEYIAFIDSDDYIAPDMLSTLYNSAKAAEADIAVCGFSNVNEEGKVLSRHVERVENNIPIDVKENRYVLNMFQTACNKLYRLRLFKETGIRYPSRVWYEDLRTTPKLVSRAEFMVFSDKCLYNYFVRSGSITRSVNVKRFGEIIEAMEDVLDFYKKEGIYDEYHSELEFMTLRFVFWESSVRVLRVTDYDELLESFRDFLLSRFPNAFKNKYLDDYIKSRGIKGSLVFSCLKNKRYRLLHRLLTFNLKVLK